MDEQRFEELSKKLATSVSRRQAVRILGATALGGVASLAGARGAWARQCRGAGDNCRSNAECCTRFCDPTFHCACPQGFVVCQDECIPACPPGQLPNPTTCQCECSPAVVCSPPRVPNASTCQCECPAGSTACGQTACCAPDQICQNGTCSFCPPGETPCGSACCGSGYVCDAGSGTCTCIGTPCGDVCCPFGLVCDNGTCMPGIVCGGDVCDAASQFCCPTFSGGECCNFSQGCDFFFGCL